MQEWRHSTGPAAADRAFYILMRLKLQYCIPALLIAIAVAAACLPALSRQRAAGVVVTFMGYTNPPTGERVALFGVANSSGYAIERLSPAIELEAQPGLRAPGLNPTMLTLTRSIVGRGHTVVLPIAVPTAGGRWRLLLRYQLLTLGQIARNFLMSHGHAVPFSVGPLTLVGPPEICTTHSAWLEK